MFTPCHRGRLRGYASSAVDTRIDIQDGASQPCPLRDSNNGSLKCFRYISFGISKENGYSPQGAWTFTTPRILGPNCGQSWTPDTVPLLNQCYQRSYSQLITAKHRNDAAKTSGR